MLSNTLSRAYGGGATKSAEKRSLSPVGKLLTTKEVATLTGLSTSYFEKGRIYGYGPKFIRLRSGAKGGGIRYRLGDILDWLVSQECDPEGCNNV